MENVIYLWKSVGITPLKAIFNFKDKNPSYSKEIISYAGRLDPMAEGILILLIGEENKNRDIYLGLDKEYETEIIFGISTDTFDSLGLIQDTITKDISKNEIEKQLKKFIGKQKQVYPPFSSKTVDGKPLYWWSRNNKLDEIELPKKQIEIYSIELLEYEKVPVKNVVEKIIEKIKNVDGDFRQEEIILNWKKFQEKNNEKDLIKIKFKANCSSGTYIRRLSDDLGKELGNAAFAYSIKRTKIGEIEVKDCINL